MLKNRKGLLIGTPDGNLRKVPIENNYGLSENAIEYRNKKKRKKITDKKRKTLER